jgi:hypothetical protein
MWIGRWDAPARQLQRQMGLSFCLCLYRPGTGQREEHFRDRKRRVRLFAICGSDHMLFFTSIYGRLALTGLAANIMARRRHFSSLPRQWPPQKPYPNSTRLRMCRGHLTLQIRIGGVDFIAPLPAPTLCRRPGIVPNGRALSLKIGVSALISCVHDQPLL